MLIITCRITSGVPSLIREMDRKDRRHSPNLLSSTLDFLAGLPPVFLHQSVKWIEKIEGLLQISFQASLTEFQSRPSRDLFDHQVTREGFEPSTLRAEI